MPRFTLHYPVKPHVVNQKWGIYGEIYKQFGFTRHNGEDLNLVIGQRISAPFDGKVIKVGFQPNGGGNFIGILSKEEFTFEDGITCPVLLDFLHCSAILVKEGDLCTLGDKIALGGNSGLSTNPHTHVQPRRCRYGLNVLSFIDKNDANGSFDPDPYWSGEYAETIANLTLQVSLYKQVIVLLKKLLGL